MAIAEVVVNIMHSDVDRLFDYRIPNDLLHLQVGVEVLVPFNRRMITGFVVGIKDKSEVEIKKLRPIKQVLHNGEVIVNSDLIQLAKSMASHYLTTLSSTLDCIVPGGLRGLGRNVSISYKKKVRLNIENKDSWPKTPSNAYRQQAVIKLLSQYKELELSQLKKMAGLSNNQPINVLEKKGIVSYLLTEHYRSPLVGNDKKRVSTVPRVQLNSYQQQALSNIEKQIEHNQYCSFLLHGVTGSGKTEVYIRAIELAIKQEKQAIMLVPEITLTPQTIERLNARFHNQIAVLHSSLSKGERYDEWRRIATGKVNVVVGARSAIFAPVKKVGVIIIDEEHESTYKQQDSVRYDARLVAQWRAKMHNAVIISGSATPAINSYYQTKQGESTLLSLPKRITKHSLPKVQIVDMREEMKKGNLSVISNALREELVLRVRQKGEKAVILLNRRGFSNAVMCRQCGYVVKCDKCDLALTYHAYDNLLKCHYCDTYQRPTKICPQCMGNSLRPLGSGTQKAELVLQKLLPGIDIIRMDSDTTQRKNAHHYLLKRFKEAKSGILLGTQMIAKGLDIPEITLVGVVNADISLNLPDYRADERTFQLLTQVAGRSGRGDVPGKVIIQTYSPDHYSIKLACAHDYLSFYNNEITYRRNLLYPPFSSLIRVICKHEEERIARRGVFFMENLLQKLGGNYHILGPAPAPINKINKYFRWHFIVKYHQDDCVHKDIKSVVNELRKRSTKLEKPLHIIVDVDPENIV